MTRREWLASDANPDPLSRAAHRALAEAKPREYPSIAAQAGNLAGSVLRFIAAGGATVPREEYDRRRSICPACPTDRYDPEQDRCSACGCYASVKPWGTAEACPDGHW